MSKGILKTDGDEVVDQEGNVVILRGAGLGGWMNMENFITGYPGHESEHRAAMLAVLGKEKYEFFFDKFLEYFFTEADAKFYQSLGLNCLRLPFNYRHLEDDMNPRVLKVEGFKHLDRVIDLCAAHGIYTILDMHTLPGGQNPDWHSDNPTAHASFWDYKDHQDRTIWLWKEIAARYRGNAWVAGYNPINEPCDPLHYRLPAFYARLEPEIRAVDPEHILWLDGNTFAMEWKGFGSVEEGGTGILPNSVYALHDYSMMGFPTGPRFKGTSEQKAALERQFLRKAAFQHSHCTPAWNGEFGPVYADPLIEGESAAAEINQERYSLLGAQLEVYDKYSIPWSIWLYKDIGLQGMVHTSPTSFYNTTISPFLIKKRRLQLDAWGKYPSPEVSEILNPLIKWIDEVAPEAKEMYPTPWATERHVGRRILQTYVSKALQTEFARLFEGMGVEELEECASSFKWENCEKREGLNGILKKYAEVAVGGGVGREGRGERVVVNDGDGEEQAQLP